MSLAIGKAYCIQYELLNLVVFILKDFSPDQHLIVYDNCHLPHCPHAVIVQQMLLHIICSLSFTPFEFGSAWTGNLFFFNEQCDTECPSSFSWYGLSYLFFHLTLLENHFEKTSTERVDPDPYLKPSHINHQFIRSLVFVFARFNNSYNRWESPPNNVFIIQVPSTEILHNSLFLYPMSTADSLSKSNAVSVSIIKAVCISNRIFHLQKKSHMWSSTIGWTALHQW